MKKIILTSAMFAFAAIAVKAQTEQAQPAQPQPQPQYNHVHRHHHGKHPVDAKMRAARITKKMTRELGLTPDVRTQVYDVNYATVQKIIDVNTKYPGDPKAGAEERKQIRMQRDARLRTLLNADQFAKWKQFEKDHRKRAKRMRHSKPTQPAKGN